jgi:hypothetical protein
MATKTKTAAPDLFAAAPVVKAPPTPKAKRGEKKKTIDLGENLNVLAALDQVAEAVAGARVVYEGMIKDQVTDIFVEEGMELGKRPENMLGKACFSTASLELRKRSSASALNTDDQALLAKYNVPMGEKVIKDAVPERFFFNPEILENPKLRAKVSAALGGVDFGGIAPLLQQPAEPAITAKVASDESIQAVFTAADNAKDVAQLMKLVTTLALKVKMNTGDIKIALEVLEGAGLDKLFTK